MKKQEIRNRYATEEAKRLANHGIELYVVCVMQKEPVEEDQIARNYLNCFKKWIITPVKKHLSNSKIYLNIYTLYNDK